MSPFEIDAEDEDTSPLDSSCLAACHLTLLMLANKSVDAIEHDGQQPVDDRLLYRLIRLEPRDARSFQQAILQLNTPSSEPNLRLAILSDVSQLDASEMRRQSDRLRELLAPKLDVVIRVSNNALVENSQADWTPQLANEWQREQVMHIAQAIMNTIERPGLIGVDHTDLFLLKQTVEARAAVAVAKGPARAELATRQAVQQVVVEGQVCPARMVMVCITSGLDLAPAEVDAVMDILTHRFSARTELLISHVFEPTLEVGQIRIVVIAAGMSG